MIIKIHNFFTVAFIVLLLIYVLLIAKVSYLGSVPAEGEMTP